MTDDLEIYCPECGKLFKGEKNMLKHVDQEHVLQKKHAKELVLEVVCRYLGGHPAFTTQADGVLSLYSHPVDKVVFQSDYFGFEIPIVAVNKVKVAEGSEIDAMRVLLVGVLALAWQRVNKIFYIEFQDSVNQPQTVVFDHSNSMDEFAESLEAVVSKSERTKPKPATPEEQIPNNTEDPLHIIKIRYAKGEITKEQYEEMKRTLTS
ncbi:MAG: SHOCT domain-containing protein [Candidatus Bathyarchaeia archaeon]|jgi:uncharacterized C2H2 Zn-finger protein